MDEKKASNSLIGLLTIMATLRSAGGCPWDAAQTSRTLRPYLLEEAHEVLEAINDGHPSEICEELGDLLLQIVFLARIFEENKEFDFGDVVDSIKEKLIRRHPHVFSPEKLQNSPDVEHQWQAIKNRERRLTRKHESSFLDRIPQTLPSLAKAGKIIAHLSRFNPEESELFRSNLLLSLLPLFKNICREPSTVAFNEEELGKMLLFLIDAGYRNHLDAEEALRLMISRLETKKI